MTATGENRMTDTGMTESDGRILMNRNLDYRYFPMQRENGLEYVCFTDLKTYERDRILKAQSAEWLETLCRDLANALQEIGDKLDLSREGSAILIGEHPESQEAPVYLFEETPGSDRPHRRRKRAIQ